MSVKRKDRHYFIQQAINSNIPPGLLAWRERMGFPIEHLDATGMVGDRYVYETFDQGNFDAKKTEKKLYEKIGTSRYIPGSSAPHNRVKVSYRKTRIKN